MQQLLLYQIIFLLIAIIAVILIFKRFKNDKTSLPTFIIWTLLWIFLVIFAFVPHTIDVIAHLIGIGTGANLLFIIAILGCFYLIFRLYSKIDDLDQNINDLVRELAIKNEISLEDDDDEK
jgi:hypothetical protein